MGNNSSCDHTIPQFSLYDLRNTTNGRSKHVNHGCSTYSSHSDISRKQYAIENGFRAPQNGEFVYSNDGPACCLKRKWYNCDDGTTPPCDYWEGNRPGVTRKANPDYGYKGDDGICAKTGKPIDKSGPVHYTCHHRFWKNNPNLSSFTNVLSSECSGKDILDYPRCRWNMDALGGNGYIQKAVDYCKTRMDNPKCQEFIKNQDYHEYPAIRNLLITHCGASDKNFNSNLCQNLPSHGTNPLKTEVFNHYCGTETGFRNAKCRNWATTLTANDKTPDLDGAARDYCQLDNADPKFCKCINVEFTGEMDSIADILQEDTGNVNPSCFHSNCQNLDQDTYIPRNWQTQPCPTLQSCDQLFTIQSINAINGDINIDQGAFEQTCKFTEDGHVVENQNTNVGGGDNEGDDNAPETDGSTDATTEDGIYSQNDKIIIMIVILVLICIIAGSAIIFGTLIYYYL